MTERKVAVIGREARVRGRVAGDEDLLVYGRVEGEVDLRGALRVEPGAVVRAQIRATAVRVAGVVVGALTASDLVHLCSTARVVGDVRAARVVIEPGAQLAGGLWVEGEARAAEGPRRSFTEPARARIEPQPLRASPPRSSASGAPLERAAVPAEHAAAQDVSAPPAAAAPAEVPAAHAPHTRAEDRAADVTVRDVPLPAPSEVAQALTAHGAWIDDDEPPPTPAVDPGHGRVTVRPRSPRPEPRTLVPPPSGEADAGAAARREGVWLFDGDAAPPPRDTPTVLPTSAAPASERATSYDPAPERRESYRPQPELRAGAPRVSEDRPTELGLATGRPTLEARGRSALDTAGVPLEPGGRPTVLAPRRGLAELDARALRTSLPSQVAPPGGATQLEPRSAPPGLGVSDPGTRLEPAPEETRTTLATRPGRALPLVEAVPSSTPPRGRGPVGRAEVPPVPAPRELRGTELPSQLPHPSMVAPSAVEPARRRVLVRLRRRGGED